MKILRVSGIALCALAVSFLVCEAFLAFCPGVLSPWDIGMVWDHWAISKKYWRIGAVHYNSRYRFDDYVGYVRQDVVDAVKRYRPEPHSFTALFLGDSITEPEFSYAGQMQSLLSARLPGLRWRGINTGTLGYDTALEKRLLERYAIHLQPDLIVLQFCLNDFNSTPLIARDSEDSWMAYNAGALTPWISASLFAHSKAYRLLASALIWAAEREESRPSRMEKVRRGLDAIAKIAVSHRVPLRILIFPYFGVEDSRLTDIREIISELHLNSVTIDLAQKYQAVPGRQLRLFPADPIHPSEEGHRIAAEALLESLRPLFRDWGNKEPSPR